MGMQTDVSVSAVLTADGQFKESTGTNNILRCRVKSVYIVPAATAGSVVFKNGGTGGTVIMTINTVASATQPTYMILPGEGVLFQTDVFADVTNIGSVIIFYA
jgi:hypothetical protein